MGLACLGLAEWSAADAAGGVAEARVDLPLAELGAARYSKARVFEL